MSNLLARMAPYDFGADDDYDGDDNDRGERRRSDDDGPSEHLSVDVATLAKLDSAKKASAQEAKAQRKAAARLRRQESAAPASRVAAADAEGVGDGSYFEREFPHEMLRVNVFARLSTGALLCCAVRRSLFDRFLVRRHALLLLIFAHF